MMRRIRPGVSTCSEHGGEFSERQAFDHLMACHPESAAQAERIIAANRDALENAGVSVNPLIGDFDRPNRTERRRAERAERRANGRHVKYAKRRRRRAR